MELFFDGDELLGFVFSDPVTWSAVQGRADLPDTLWDEMVACAAAKAEGAEGKLTFEAHGWDAPQLAALTRAGFVPQGGRRLRLVRVPEPSDLAAVALPEGFHFADMSTGEIGLEARVGIHQDVWHPSKVTPEAYARLQAAPLYRPDYGGRCAVR